jgi:dolichol-phosphate mannosyltransferase
MTPIDDAFVTNPLAGHEAAEKLSTDAGPELAVIIPTFNEVGNVQEIANRLDAVLKGVRWEVIFVDDDSPDGTALAVMEMGKKSSHIRCLKRVGRRGLSSACIEGMLSTSATYLAVMDADLQHDESILPQMLEHLRSHHYQLAIGTRYMQGGGVGEWNAARQSSSRMATWVSQKMLGVKLNDPMSGFFMITRQAFEPCVNRLSSMGFKILLDIVVSSPKTLSYVEVPFHFRNRLFGESKLDQKVIWDYYLLLVDKTLGGYIPTPLVSFATIGALGVLVHMAVLGLTLKEMDFAFEQAQSCAVLMAMVFNFQLNNILTYRDQKLSGREFWLGLFKFILACGVGAAANVGVASFIYKGYGYWLFSGLAGILVGLVWNYLATSLIVWPKRKPL